MLVTLLSIPEHPGTVPCPVRARHNPLLGAWPVLLGTWGGDLSGGGISTSSPALLECQEWERAGCGMQ